MSFTPYSITWTLWGQPFTIHILSDTVAEVHIDGVAHQRTSVQQIKDLLYNLYPTPESLTLIVTGKLIC